MSNTETSGNSTIDNATDSEKYPHCLPHTEEGNLKLLQDLDEYKTIGIISDSKDPHTLLKIAQRKAFADLSDERRKALKPIVRQLTVEQIEMARFIISAEEIKKRAEKIKECNLPITIFPFLSAERIEDLKSLLPGKILNDFLEKFTPRQLKECGKIDPLALAKHRDTLKNIKPEEKVTDIIENAYLDNIFE